MSGGFSDGFSGGFSGGGSGGDSDCDHEYCSRTDVEQVFGVSNVAKWADLDNDSDEDKITARVNYFICLATCALDDDLRGGPYPVPWESPYPRALVFACARLVGVLLYDARGFADMDANGNPMNKMGPHRKAVKDWVKRVRGGKTRVGDFPGVTHVPKAIPICDTPDERERKRRMLSQDIVERQYEFFG